MTKRYRMMFGFSPLTAVSLLVLIVEVSASQPREWTAATYPLTGDARCGGYSGSICDPDGVIGNKDAVEELSTLINLVDKESCACGHCKPLQAETDGSEGFKIGIAAVGKLQTKGSGNSTWERMDIVSFAKAILKKWSLGSCRNGLIIAISNETGQYATVLDETTELRLHRECLVRRGQSEAEKLIKQGQNVEGLKLLIHQYKQMIKKGSCLMSKTIWLIIAFTLAPAGIIFAICYLGCKSSTQVIRAAREKRSKQMMHKKLEEYSRSSSETSSNNEDDKGCSTSGQYKSIVDWRRDVPSVSQAVTREDVERGNYRADSGPTDKKRYSDVWVKATPN